MVKATCSVCGKEYEVQDGTPAAGFVTDHPERARCMDCFKAGGANAKKATAKAKGFGKSDEVNNEKKSKMTAEVLRKSYDEVVAAFEDVLPDVIQFIGGWTTTIALSKTK